MHRKLGMKDNAVKRRTWKKPEIQGLGVIKDVAGPQGPGPQGAGAKT